MIREICLAVLLIAAITAHVGGQWRGVRVQSLDGRARGFGAAGVFSGRRSRGGFGEGWGGPGGGGGGGGGGGKLARHYVNTHKFCYLLRLTFSLLFWIKIVVFCTF